MSEVLRNDIFRFTADLPVQQGFYRLCKSKPENPQFYLPNLLVSETQLDSRLPAYFADFVVSTDLFNSIEDGDIGIVNNGNMIRVILSRRANHNTVLVTERCNSGSLADEDIIAKLLVESDPHKIIALFNSETESADA
ncbi:hypothetical protein KAM644c_24880 [Klebsiella quasipneumoniae subsp. quasipneumoniae]|uniref:Uncharacterized protein n=1 Tax=Klebsiella quasipneumoniae subsp. quasipneumoniae TaxID=1667327 RepID=A0AAN1Y4L5_9ENTR|nr:hypothetical protein KAM644c_24880 [Klebsiella quasipneumoniae subsp. quasipneumoniae]